MLNTEPHNSTDEAREVTLAKIGARLDSNEAAVISGDRLEDVADQIVGLRRAVEALVFALLLVNGYDADQVTDANKEHPGY